MDSEVIPLMVDVLEKRLNKDVLAYQPSEEGRRFAVQVEKTVILIDESLEVFVPLKRGDCSIYLDLKRILKDLDLKYNTRTEYTG